MSTRGFCEFKNCNCANFIGKHTLCTLCNHADIWHYNKNKPPSDIELQFLSPRENARIPVYTTERIIPIVFAEPIYDYIFCPVVDALPV